MFCAWWFSFFKLLGLALNLQDCYVGEFGKEVCESKASYFKW